ncbi:MAG: nitrogen regulation protein NR(II) [Planctomycetota bacterium]
MSSKPATLEEVPANASGDTQRRILELTAMHLEVEKAFAVMAEQFQIQQRQLMELAEQNRTKDRLLQRRSRLEAIGQMAAGLAHEIRNPLGGIRLNADNLLRRLETADRSWQEARLGAILREIDALNRLVGDMLGFTREVVIRRQPESVKSVILAALELASAHESSAGHLTDVAVVEATLWADGQQLQRVFLNIILNAYQAMKDPGQLTVRGRIVSDRGVYVITFCDSGTGIPEDKLDEVFNPFMTTKAEGTGLGLSIAHRIIEGHEGRIEARNNAERGATIIVTLPLGKPEGVVA